MDIALRRRSRSGFYFETSQNAGIFSDAAWRLLQKSLALTNRQLQITKAIFDNEKEAAIAEKLGVSVHTIHTETQRLRNKLHVHDRVSLVLRVVCEFLSLCTTHQLRLSTLCATQTTSTGRIR